MKGVKYNLKMCLPQEREFEMNSLNMKDLCSTIKDKFSSEYFLDNIKCNNQIVYNLMKRPHTTNSILRDRVFITKCIV